LARTIAKPLGWALGQAVVVEYKPGGNTIIEADAVAQAAPDGYTLFMGSSASLANCAHWRDAKGHTRSHGGAFKCCSDPNFGATRYESAF
jgi:tripartite-type tricarboxylate transporter receptor subunit TctC